jgi:hypothetical protein
MEFHMVRMFSQSSDQRSAEPGARLGVSSGYVTLFAIYYNHKLN